ncbi:MAG: gamma-glutamyltransferase, partial [Verrucomicrobia bacterium]|nr:gamma-glutamyltransferase [Verrucomicrobiota bacterium]
MTRNLSRRSALKLVGTAALAGVFAPRLSFAAEQSPPDYSHGAVIGEITAAKAGLRILADGGNAVDAAVASALVAAIVAPQSCGLGGYGGSAVVALARKKQVTAIDFNTTAPAAMREDTFKPGADGKVRDRVNEHGWLASGVPGTLAGLD